jgi:hypothetical protein
MNFVLDAAGKALRDEGILPSNTCAYHVVSQTNKAVKLVIEKYLTDEEYALLLRVMAENWKASKVTV